MKVGFLFIMHILQSLHDNPLASLLTLHEITDKIKSESESHFTADSQSVCLDVEPTVRTFDQIRFRGFRVTQLYLNTCLLFY
jgi:hypothetical protein